ncbi:MAG: hypothetical protein H6Q00_2212 [Holophagaceae bacterium]|nr:hypothetical protein [Holophagaceae bacterium]
MSAVEVSSKVQRVGIVGGGRAGLRFFNLLHQSKGAEVSFVVDRHNEAPAIAAARQARVPVYTDMEAAVRSHPTDLVFEVTGHAETSEHLTRLLERSSTRVLTSDLARLLVQILEEDRHRIENEVVGDIGEMKTEITESLKGSGGLVGRINSVMSSMQMLALNASIEAAKAGVHGLGFAVVADNMGKSVETVRKLTLEIETMNAKIRQVALNIDRVLDRLK